MKANELREGNWVTQSVQMFSGPKHQVIQVRLKDLFNTGSLEGIPLSADWLERAGFTNIGLKIPQMAGFYSLMITPEMMFLQKKGVWEFGVNIKGGGAQMPCPQLKYVHELQNLFFALTGTELSFTPSTKQE